MLERFLPKKQESRHEVAQRRTEPLDLFEEFFGRRFGDFPGFLFAELPTHSPWGRGVPAVDVAETEDEITVKADLPGVKPEEVDVLLEENTLILKGERKHEHEEKKDNYRRVERSYGSFRRVIPLSAGVKSEAIKAQYKDGVLTITIPKDEAAKPKRIEITNS